MWGPSKFSVQGKVGAALSEDDLQDHLRVVLAEDAEIFDLRAHPEGSFTFKAAPNDNIHGVKAKLTSRVEGGETSLSVEGRTRRMRWFWWFIHYFFVLVFVPYAFIALPKFADSKRKARSYGEDVIRRIRKESQAPKG